MTKQKKPKTPGVANPAMHAAMFAKRISGAAGTHAQGTPRERTRATSKRAAIRRELDSRAYGC